MAHRNWMLIVNDNKNNRTREFKFTSKLDYENQLNKVKQDFTIIQENTMTSLDVELAPTIFDDYEVVEDTLTDAQGNGIDVYVHRPVENNDIF